MKTKITLFAGVCLFGALAGMLRSAEPLHLFVPVTTASECYYIGDIATANLEVGSTQEEVLAKIGKPAGKITRHDWVYHNVALDTKGQGMEAYDTLVVSFKNEMVSGIHLIKRTSLERLIAASRGKANGGGVEGALFTKSK